MSGNMKSSSLLSTLSSFSSGTAVVKTNTPNTATANLKAAVAAANAAAAAAGLSSSASTSTTPPQTLTSTTNNKLTTNAIVSLNNAVNNSTTQATNAAAAAPTAPPINLKISLKMELLPNEKLFPTPSMQDGLLFEDEFDLRLIGCELIQTAGRLLKLPQTAMATGQVLFHRFFYSKSFVKNHMEHYAMASIFLSSKIEECPRRIRDVMNVFHHIKLVRTGKIIKPMPVDSNYYDTKNQVIKAERRILKELGFCVHVKHPHKIIFIYLRAMEATQLDLSQKAWNYMNDSLRTDIFLRYSPENIVCACIYLSARELNIPLPQQPAWYTIFGADEESLKAISVRILHLYSHKTKSQEELEKIVETCREKMNEEKRRTREASSILAAANQKTLQMTGDLLIAEKISQLKSNDSASNLLLQQKNSEAAKLKAALQSSSNNNIETKSTKSSKNSSHASSSKHSSSSPSSHTHHHHKPSSKHSSILNTHPTNPYHLNNNNNSNNAHMGRHASFNYSYFSGHHHPPSHYPSNLAPLPGPPGYYPGPEYFGQYPDAEAYYNENSYYDINLRKNKSSSSLRNDMLDYPVQKSSHRYPADTHHHHHRSNKSGSGNRRSRSRSQSGSKSPSSTVAPSGPGRRMPSHVTKSSTGGRQERKRSTRSRSRSIDSVDSLSEKRRSRSPSSHSKSKKKKSHHHSHSRKEEASSAAVTNDAGEIIEQRHHHHRSSKDKNEKEKGEHRSEKSGTRDKEKRSSSHHKSSSSSSKSKEHSSKDRPANNNTNNDSRYIPIYS